MTMLRRSVLSMLAAGFSCLSASATMHGPSEVAVSGGAVVVSLDGSPRSDGMAGDLDSLTVQSAARLAGEGWAAELSPGSRATLRTEPLQDAFRRVVDLAEGSARFEGAWATRAGEFVLSADNAKIDVSYRDGLLAIEHAEGDTVEVVGTSASLQLAAGQKLNIRLDIRTLTFRVEVIDDAGSPIDVKIGRVVIQVSAGDLVDATADGEDLEVVVRTGDVKVLGSDGSLQELGMRQSARVAGGATGAVKGATRGRLPRPRRDLPSVRQRRFYEDRTDISPS